MVDERVIMKEVGDVVGWVVGILGTIVLINWRMDTKSDNDKFKSLFDAQRSTETKIGVVETKLDGIQAHYIQTLEDIKAQQIKMAENVTDIKVSIASLPKRKDDDG